MNDGREDFVLREILESENICTYFQPIVSLKTGTIVAYEALVRGIRNDSDSLITPCELFDRADRDTVSLEFDCLCRKKALESFSGFRSATGAMMFLNINTSVISAHTKDNPHIGTVSRQMGFDPRYLGLELIESRAQSAEDLIDFVRHYRSSGFLIVIDDFGCEHSNIDRLIQIRPDIIKVDRSIISGIETDFYRQSILKSIHSLAEMTGALCLAEGVETLEEIRTCHVMGVDLFQGFAVACPAPDLNALEERTLRRITEIRDEIRQSSVEALRVRRRLTGDINVLADWLVRQVYSCDLESMYMVFQEFIAVNNEIECVYLLDSGGIQVSDTIAPPVVRDRTRASIFKPAAKGANHSFKPYFTCFEALRVNRYLTDVYLSLATGNLCRTFSVQLDTEAASGLVLCIDFLEEAIRTSL